MRPISKIYSNSPLLLQNMLVSAYGVKLFYERYLGVSSFRKNLINTQFNSADSISESQLKNLIQLLTHSYEYVPYYRKIFRDYEFNPLKITSASDLQRLPPLDKEIIRTQPDDFISEKFEKRKLIPLNTSGSTGKSLQILVDRESRRKAYAFTSRYHSWAGLDGTHNATFGGRVIVPQNQREHVYWRYNAVMQNHLFSTYHMSEATLPYYVSKLREIKPQFIEAYPSAVYILARFMADNGMLGISPKAVLTSGETLFDHQRDLIQKVFKCPVFDQYGCTEQALFISQCEEGTYHVHPEFGIVELLDANDRPVGPGETGRVVCTSFLNYAMPLIRYNLGDLAEWGEGICRCKRHFPIIKKIVGRQDDVIVTPDGRMVGRLDPIFKGLGSIKAAQIIQYKLNKIVVKIVPSKEYNQNASENIVNELKLRLGGGVDITIELVDSVEMSKNGKFKSVISCLKHSAS